MEKYIVMRHHSTFGAADGDAAMTLALEGGSGKASAVAINTCEMNEGEAAQLAMQSDTLIAPAMPLQLIEPIAMSFASIDNAPGNIAWGLSAIGADQSSFDGSGVRMGIIDTGVDPSHECFKGVDFEMRDYTGEGVADINGHGTHCAATIFGRDVNGIRVGVAREVKDVFVGKTMGVGRGDSGMLIQAISDAVEYGCRVISMSLGFDHARMATRLRELNDWPTELATAVALHRYRANVRMFDRLGALLASRPATGQHEVLLIAASGNASKRDVNSSYEMPAMPPSEADEFISVGAVGVDTAKAIFVAPFSNINCTLCAPGVNILSAQAGTTQGLVAKSGTSMAAPHVAGVAALHIQASSKKAMKSSLYQRAPTVRQQLLKETSLANLPPEIDERHVGLGVIRAPR